MPDGINGNFSGIVIDRDNIYLRAVRRYTAENLWLTVMSSVPVTANLLQSVTSHLGSVTLIPPDPDPLIVIETGTVTGFSPLALNTMPQE